MLILVGGCWPLLVVCEYLDGSCWFCLLRVKCFVWCICFLLVAWEWAVLFMWFVKVLGVSGLGWVLDGWSVC